MDIKETLEINELLEVCNRIKETRDCRISEKVLLRLMGAGNITDRVRTFVSYDQDKMTGCAVLLLQEDLTGDMTLFLIYMYIDKHYPLLTEQYIKLIEEKAKEMKADKISFTTHRNPKAVIRKYGKYGYYHRCSVIDKKIGKEVV
jgi:hypothetical protein